MRNSLVEARGTRTQIKIAREMGISQKYLSKLELGQRTPSLKTAIKIASYYKSSIEILFPDIFLPKESTNSSNGCLDSNMKETKMTTKTCRKVNTIE